MLLNKMPSIYSSSGMMIELFRVEDNEIQTLNNSTDDALNQFFIESADDTIDRWEKEVGLPKSSLPLDQRKSTVKSKLRGYGTVTVSHLKTVCDSYTNGDVDVIEKPSTYEFEIKFNNVRGIPPNMDDLKRIISQIKPAHLGVTYAYKYLTMSEFSSYNLTMADITSKNLTMAEWATYKQ